MKKLIALLIVLAAVAGPAVAAKKQTPASPQSPVATTANGRLALTPEILNSARPQVGITASGKLISVMPTNGDPALLAQWEATQVWIDENIDRLQGLVVRWQAEARTQPDTNAIDYVNRQLQQHLDRSGALADIERISATMIHIDPGPSVQSLKSAALSSCGPRGTCMNAVNCCVEVCDPGGCHEWCSVCDCDPGCAGCCGYGFPKIIPIGD